MFRFSALVKNFLIFCTYIVDITHTIFRLYFLKLQPIEQIDNNTLQKSEVYAQCSGETLQNLPKFWNTKLFSFCANFFPLMNAQVYVDITRAFIRGKKKVGFSYCKNMEIFEAFLQSIQLSINLLFLKCDNLLYLIRALCIHRFMY